MTAPSIPAKWPTSAPYLLSVLRIVAAFLFMQFGTAKLFAFPAAIMPGGGTAPIASLPGIAGTLETFGGLFLLLGLFTRPVAFIVAGEMAVAYFLGHARSEEHTSELQSLAYLVCRLLLEKKKIQDCT